MTEVSPTHPRANVLGLGLIGASLALALRDAGYQVGGDDSLSERSAEAFRRGIVDQIGLFVDPVVTFVAVPAGSLVESCRRVLSSTTGLVTDVGSVKSAVAEHIDDPRFIGGHPMAGSELTGLDGADASMFRDCVWVLTPSRQTSDDTFASVARIVGRLGAEVVAMTPRQHDDIVAVVSHVPHLIAATLMTVAESQSETNLALLRLAAGGFRDMTRIASGQPAIWLDICDENKLAICDSLERMIRELSTVREVIAKGERRDLLERLEKARRARHNLPVRAGDPGELVECRIPVPDRPGSAADVFVLSGELGVNVIDFEVVHSAEGDRGVMVLVVRQDQIELFRGGLLARGFRPSIAPLT